MKEPEEITPDSQNSDREIVGYLMDRDDFGWAQLQLVNKALELKDCACSAPIKMVGIGGCCQDDD